MLAYKGYQCKTTYNRKVKIFEGEVLGAGAPIYFEASTKESVQSEFKSSVDSFLEWCAENGVSPNGPLEGVFITIQLEEGLYNQLKKLAAREGKTVHDFIVQAIEMFVANHTVGKAEDQS